MTWFLVATVVSILAGLGLARLEAWADERDKKERERLVARITGVR